ncbi:hypothetical protein EB796_014025 [Bugula neritina]|uniref:Uncharacterized protein n=1 Tax=Bugula neritina TaxID=10212 RepID=A0A7J7JNT9_BUGNE|nr:hypothetical protein EB796_014025 [Bugula neritina]
MNKIQPSIGGKLLMLSSDGNIVETGINISDLITTYNIDNYAIPKLQEAIGNRLVLSTSDGDIIESSESLPVFSSYSV